MQKTLVTIAALSVDTRHAVLYLMDGSTMTIAQGDARLPRIVAESRTALEAGRLVQVDVAPVIVQRTEFNDAEKGTKGVVKFFRVAKAFLKKLVDTESPEKVDEAVAHVSPLEIGVFPGQGTKEEDDTATQAPAVVDAAPIAEKSPADMTTDELAAELQEFAQPVQNATTRQTPAAQTNDQKLDVARERMLQLVGNSVGTDRAEFHTPLGDGETIVAVHEKTGTIIPDAHKLARQLRSAQKLQDYTGFTRFVERLSLIINDRTHSVEDLMKFIEKGDLPIADDGCIVIFKRLNKRGDHFVDVHSGNIKQKVGSYVFMKPGLVDPNRRKDCSNGLHVASLSYLGGFSGDVTVLAKVRPEDVFAVPEYAHNKMRVCGYHILANLPDKLRTLVNGGGSISSDPDGAQLLANVLRGNHVSITQHVEVGGHQGSNVTYTDVQVNTVEELPVKLAHAETLDMVEELTAKVPVAPEIKAADLVPIPVIKNLMSNSTEKEAEADSFEQKLAEEIGGTAPADNPAPVVDSATNTGTVVAEPQEKAAKPQTQADRAKQLYNAWHDAMTYPQSVAAARELREFKKQTRKGWTALGLAADTGDALDKQLNASPVPAKTKPVKAAQAVKSVSKPKDKASAKSQPDPQVNLGKGTDLEDPVKAANRLLKEGKKTNVEIAQATGLSKDQVYRLKKKLKS
jgi:hypothetical protein